MGNETDGAPGGKTPSYGWQEWRCGLCMTRGVGDMQAQHPRHRFGWAKRALLWLIWRVRVATEAASRRLRGEWVYQHPSGISEPWEGYVARMQAARQESADQWERPVNAMMAALAFGCCCGARYPSPNGPGISALEWVATHGECCAPPWPSRAEMEAALDASGADEVFAFGGTIRRCLDCRTPIFGGPTRCVWCALKPL